MNPQVTAIEEVHTSINKAQGQGERLWFLIETGMEKKKVRLVL